MTTLHFFQNTSLGQQNHTHRHVHPLRISKRETPKQTIDLTWPSGQGIEIASYTGSIKSLMRHFQTHHGSFAGNLADVMRVQEDGAEAIIILGSKHGPISFAQIPELDARKLSIVADAKANSGAVLNDIYQIVPKRTIKENRP